MNFYERRRQESVARLVAELAKPLEAEPRADGIIYDDDEFDPWSLFPALYGSYSSDFDECALDVLRELRDREKRREDLGAEMFREMLCTAEMCDYGTSPRVCFWALDAPLLTALIDRWAEWSAVRWSEHAQLKERS